MRGNFIRDKAKELIAAITMRFGPAFEKFCTLAVSELQKPEIKDGSIESQLEKDAIYQILDIRLGDESNIEVEPLIKAVQEDLEREQSYTIVKARAIQLLQKLSDFETLKNDTVAQETLINGVITLYVSSESDMYLQMSCMEYLKNFYNDHQFKVAKYSHLL